jgi:hypothetical protein
MRRYTVSVTTAADGSVTAYTPRIRGTIHQIEYIKHGVTPFADTVDFAITGELTGVGLWTQANVTATSRVAPRQPVHDQVGVAALYADAGEAIVDKVAISGDRVKIAITNGGDSKLGTFHILVG